MERRPKNGPIRGRGSTARQSARRARLMASGRMVLSARRVAKRVAPSASGPERRLRRMPGRVARVGEAGRVAARALDRSRNT